MRHFGTVQVLPYILRIRQETYGTVEAMRCNIVHRRDG